MGKNYEQTIDISFTIVYIKDMNKSFDLKQITAFEMGLSHPRQFGGNEEGNHGTWECGIFRQHAVFSPGRL